MPYSWDPISKRFRDPKGRYIPEKDILKILDVALETKDAVNLTRSYTSGQISKDVWHTGMRTAIKNAYLQAAMLAKGGRAQMTPADWGKAGGHISEQFYHLDRKFNNFLSQIDDLTPAQAEARAKMYINSARQIYEEMRREEMMGIAVFEKWVLGIAEHCPDCIALSRLGIVPIGTLYTVPGAGETQCLTNCKCRIAYYNQKKRRLSAKEVVQYYLTTNQPFTVLLTDFGDVIIPGEYEEHESHMCRKLGGKGSGHFGHAGRPGHRGGSAASSRLVYADGLNSLRRNALGKAYFITPDNKLVDAIRPEEYIATHDQFINKYGVDLGIDAEAITRAKDGGLEDIEAMYASFSSAGLTRVRWVTGFVAIYGPPMDRKGVERIQDLLLSGHLPERKSYVWESISSSNEARYFKWDDIMQAKSPRDLKTFDQLGEEEQEFLVKLGSAKSGHYGHKGIPGHQGGSAPRGASFVGGKALDIIADPDMPDYYEEFPELEDIVEGALSDYDVAINDVATTLPAEHTEGLTPEITLFSNAKQFGEYDPDTDTIRLNAEFSGFDQMDELVVHEIGHRAAYQVPNREQFEKIYVTEKAKVKDDYHDLYTSGKEFAEIDKTWMGRDHGFVSFYSALNPDEFFAESYRAYRYHPAFLEERNSDMYQYMKGVFGGKEY